METFKLVVSNSIIIIETEYVGLFTQFMNEWAPNKYCVRCDESKMNDCQISKLPSGLWVLYSSSDIESNLDTFQLDHFIYKTRRNTSIVPVDFY